MKLPPFLIIALLLLILPTAFAAYQVNVFTHNFKFTPMDNSDYEYLCACTPRVDMYEIENIGVFDADFTISFQGHPSWLKTSEREFTIPAGGTHPLFVYLEPACRETSKGTYTITVESSYGRKKFVTRSYETKPCQNIKVYETQVPPSDPCTPIHFPLNLENIGGFRERYTLTFDDYAEYVDSSSYDITLDPGQREQLEVYVTLACDVSGDVGLPFSVHAQTNDITERFSVALPISRAYFTTFEGPGDQMLCAGIETTARTIVTNQMRFAQPLDVTIDGVRFATLANGSITVPANDTVELPITFTPGRDDIGTHTLTIRADNLYSGDAKTTHTDITVDNCFDIELTEPAVNTSILCGEHAFMVNARNQGTQTITVDLSHRGADFIDYPRIITLAPAENANIPVTADVPCVDANYTITFSARDTTGVAYDAIEFSVHALSKETAYGIDILNPKILWYYDTAVVPVIIKNTGIRGGDYELRLASDILGINVTGIHLLPGEEKTLHLWPRVGIEEFEPGRYVNQLIITQHEEDITFGRDLEVKLTRHDIIDEWIRGALIRQNYRGLGVCGIGTIVLIIIAALAAVALGRTTTQKLSPKKVSDRDAQIMTITVLFGLGIALLAATITMIPDTSGWYEGNLTSNDSLTHVWAQDHVYQIDLTRYFKDPDNEALRFTSSQPADIDVHIDGTTAYLSPVHGWSGTNRIVFTAYDPKGGSADSDLMTLIVVKQKPVGWVDHWQVFCDQINLILAAIVLFIIGAGMLVYTLRKDAIHQEQVRRVKKGRQRR